VSSDPHKYCPYERLAEGKHSLLLNLGWHVKRLRTSKGYTQMISPSINVAASRNTIGGSVDLVDGRHDFFKGRRRPEDHGNRIGVISPERIEHVGIGLDSESARLCGSKIKVRAIKEHPGMAHTIGTI
jgi:hypothetical protein